MLEVQTAAEPGPYIDVLGENFAVGWKEEDVIERQAFAKLVVDHVAI